MRVTVDLDRVVESILAGAALSAVASTQELPPLLHPDHAPALRMGARAAFRALALSLAPYLTAVSPADDALALEFDAGIEADATLLGAALEDVMALRVLHLFYARELPALSAACASAAASALDGLHAGILRRAPRRKVRLRPEH